MDWPMWLALMSGFLPLLLFMPLIKQARTYANAFWAVPSWKSIPDAYSILLMPAPLMLMLVLIFAGALSLVCPRQRPVRIARTLPSVADHELGVSVLVAWTTARILSGRPLLGVITLSLAFIGFLLLSARSFPYTTESAVGNIYTLLRSEKAADLPIVISDPHNFMMLAHYAPQDLSSRLVYLAGPQRSLQHLGHNTMDRGISDLNPWFHLNIQEADRFRSTQSRMLLYVHGGYLGGPLANGLSIPDFNWLLSDFLRGWHLQLRLRRENQLVFLVTKNTTDLQSR
jgi:hypothetical protein